MLSATSAQHLSSVCAEFWGAQPTGMQTLCGDWLGLHMCMGLRVQNRVGIVAAAPAADCSYEDQPDGSFINWDKFIPAGLGPTECPVPTKCPGPTLAITVGASGVHRS